MTYTDAFLKSVLARSKVIAVVGVSLNPVRPSYYVARYLSLRGYRVIGVNPGHAGARLFGAEVRGSIEALPAEVDMVDIFRRSEAVPGIVEDALAHLPGLRTVNGIAEAGGVKGAWFKDTEGNTLSIAQMPAS